ncbi:MAG: pantetheine-phosphate adenylyltransferase [Prevotellaceae bacterium]|jgi:pantetheine-phosphate adenylyltransferase|nr:pantetheine-phosphate adenylyltransferase [Prevotellaceae bacterium]
MTALFPGSFDPFTIGHYDVVCRALKLFDRVIIGIGTNPFKKNLFSEEDRMRFIQEATKGLRNVSVVTYHGLTVDYCKDNNITCIVRGVRSAFDYEHENVAAQANHFLQHHIDTIFLPARPEHSFVCSSVVRDVLTHGGDASALLPKGISLKEIKR